jgi:predicted HAD superfamily hydrolase
VTGIVASVYLCKPGSKAKTEYTVSFSNAFHHNTLNVCKSPPLNSDRHDTVIDNTSQETKTFVGGSGVPITTEKSVLFNKHNYIKICLIHNDIQNTA